MQVFSAAFPSHVTVVRAGQGPRGRGAGSCHLESRAGVTATRARHVMQYTNCPIGLFVY
jgi:hypothetical protein